MTEASERDALPMLALHRDVLEERAWFITLPEELTDDLDKREQLVRDLQRATNAILLVARLPGVQVAGFLTVVGGSLNRMRHLGKLEIMVAPAHRRCGVGRGLMTAVVEWATANPELEKLGLSVFADNLPAIALYREFGFEVEGERRHEYRFADGYRDDVLMYRFVAPGQ